ncbi:MAG TPA: NAD(P)/FAD-dependent oxidoreductase [Gemmatimonadaceae bacterium]|nr:NAD(P)/FAD-dependent oxidoreductase [Gemmatimonadaceae bacterium]
MGAGFAGLTAAYRLGEAGHTVTVLETQSRVGGRALTVRSSVSEGLVAQAGPARFPGAFERVLSYARQFDLALAPFYPSSGRFVAFRNGTRITNYAPTPDDFWAYSAPARSGIAGIATNSIAALRRVAGTPRARAVTPTYRFSRGTDSLAHALAAAGRGDIRLDTTVQSLVQDAGGVRVSCTTAQGDVSVDADYLVCAVPLSQLAALRFSPALPEEMRELATTIPFSSALRIFLEMRRPYWRDEGFNGFGITDTVGEIWDPHFDEAAMPALLVCYARDELAERLSALDEPRRIARAVDEVDRVLPGATAHFLRGASIVWREQRWIGGGWPMVRNGYESRISVFRRRFGRVFFAGDYATEPAWLNMVEGAIESGERAANAIHAS